MIKLIFSIYVQNNLSELKFLSELKLLKHILFINIPIIKPSYKNKRSGEKN